jgi:pyruvate dehydrogenase E2 component (dihydrolipoamide acetyltransferase)
LHRNNSFNPYHSEILKEVEFIDIKQLEGIQKIVADKMTYSASTVPHVTLTTEADVSDILRLLKQVNSIHAKENKISNTVLFIKICSIAINKNPIINSILENDL